MSELSDLEAALGLTGKVRLLALIGQGATSRVYRGEQQSLERPVAVKVLQPQGARSEAQDQRFLAEARLAARVSHPAVVRVIDSGRSGSGLFIVYELVEGRSLRERLTAGCSLDQALDWLEQAAAGIHAIHLAGVVHRDVKPENMLVTPEGDLRLTDLGIAKDLTGDQATAAGMLLGTPNYMSPEQVRGRQVGPASDIYSLGIVLYEMVTGSPPFAGRSVSETLQAHLRELPARPSQVVPGLVTAWDAPILAALEKLPSMRYPTADALAAAIRKLRPLATKIAATSRAPRRQKAAPTLAQRSVRSEPAHRLPAQPTVVGATSLRSRRLLFLAAGGLAAAFAVSFLVAMKVRPVIDPAPVADVPRLAQAGPIQLKRALVMQRLARTHVPTVEAALSRLREAVASESSVEACPLKPWLREESRRATVQELDLLLFEPQACESFKLVVRASSFAASGKPVPVQVTVHSGTYRALRQRGACQGAMVGGKAELALPDGSLGTGWNRLRLTTSSPSGASGPLEVTLHAPRKPGFGARLAQPLGGRPPEDCGNWTRRLKRRRSIDRMQLAPFLADVRSAIAEDPQCALAYRTWADILQEVMLTRSDMGRGGILTMPIDFIVSGAPELQAPAAELLELAVALQNSALALAPGWSRLWYDARTWAELLEHRPTAYRAARMALLSDPDHPDALRAVAEESARRLPVKLVSEGERAEAMDALAFARRSLEQERGPRGRVDLSAVVCADLERRLGLMADARRSLTEALRKNPSLAEAHRLSETIGP
ncbi:MAG: serine/threonine protein kinase [Candidatus Wallbacteria bacterium]|nr:serine/threonine protein kinase [Candidatus Wallbacteria bacterium]